MADDAPARSHGSNMMLAAILGAAAILCALILYP